MRKAVLVGLVALAGLWLVSMSFRGQRAPAHTATTAIPALGLTLTAEVFTLSDRTEFERRLTLATDTAELRVRMADVRGPAHRTSLYRAGEAEIAVLGPAGDDHFFATGPLRRLDGPRRRSEAWTYLGAFDFRTDPDGGPAGGAAQIFAFVPAEVEEECIPTLLEGADGGPHRRERVRRSCPPAPGPSPSGAGAAPHRARAMQNSTMPASADRSGPGGKAASAASAASP